MAVLDVITYGNPVLRRKADEITDIDDSVKSIVKDLEDTLSKEKGIGLAAPQVGISRRIFLVDLRPSGIQKRVALINPEIVYRSPKTEVYEEGCLSFPNIWGDVIRPFKIKIKGTRLSGKEMMIDAEGLYARALQHELDHLDGKLFVDYLSKSDMMKNERLLNQLIEQNKKKLGKIEK